MSADSKCMLTLYHTNPSISGTKWCNIEREVFTRETAHKANEVVTSYFGIEEEWDKKLLKSVFQDDVNYNWFGLNTKAEPDITLGIKVYGDAKILYNEGPEEDYLPVERPGRISIKKRPEMTTYDLDYPQMRDDITDNSIVALFNSNSFQRVTQYSTPFAYSRVMEKIEV